MYCRLAAADLSTLQPALAAAGCRLVGVGLEELGVEEFVAGGYFTGELYVDTDKQSFKALGFKKLGLLALGPAILAKVARSAYSKAKSRGITGDMKGDGLQNGGLLVVGSEGPKVLFEYRQENPADHPDQDLILKALGIDRSAATTNPKPQNPPTVECSEDVCVLKK